MFALTAAASQSKTLSSGSRRATMMAAGTRRRAACGGQYKWRDPNRVLIIQVGADASEANVLRFHASRRVLARTSCASWPSSVPPG